VRTRVCTTLLLVAAVWLPACQEPTFPTDPPVQVAPYTVKSDDAPRQPEPPPKTAELVVGTAAKVWIGVASAAAAIMLLVAVAVRPQGSTLWMVAALVPVAISSFAVARLFHQFITGLAIRDSGIAALAAGIWESHLPLIAGLGGGAAIVLTALLVPARQTPMVETSGTAIKVRRLLALLGILMTGAAVLAVIRMSRLMFSPPAQMSIAEMTTATVRAMLFGIFASLFAALVLVISAGLESFMRDHGSRRRRLLACAVLLVLLAGALWWDWTFLRTLATSARTGRPPPGEGS
jgi:hypothetical protein